ncbi:MAG TPA: SHOCT domain-containing protein [Gaiellaceae bacterium]|nr:SHOCT domain-containing protein [Gaiellaceae bacterium]
MAQVLSIIVTAFVTGALARFAVPGPDPMPAWLTVLIGLVGTLIGAGIVYAVAGGDPAWMGIAGFLASIALVLAYRRFVQRRPIWGPDAYRFPERGFGVPQYRERLERAGIDPDSIGSPFSPQSVLHPQQQQEQPEAEPRPAGVRADGDDPTENPAHYLGLLEELHDSGVLDDSEYDAARTRLLERLRA